ncbi:MAG: hypothetical protein WCX69_05810 [Candidatus Paceibacterota bacterium]
MAKEKVKSIKGEVKNNSPKKGTDDYTAEEIIGTTEGGKTTIAPIPPKKPAQHK